MRQVRGKEPLCFSSLQAASANLLRVSMTGRLLAGLKRKLSLLRGNRQARADL